MLNKKSKPFNADKKTFFNFKEMEELLISINSQLDKYADTVAQRDQQDAGSFGLN